MLQGSEATLRAVQENLPSAAVFHFAGHSLVTPERVSRLSRGEADGTDAADAIEQLVRSTVASLQAPALDRPMPMRRKTAAKN